MSSFSTDTKHTNLFTTQSVPTVLQINPKFCATVFLTPKHESSDNVTISGITFSRHIVSPKTGANSLYN